MTGTSSDFHFARLRAAKLANPVLRKIKRAIWNAEELTNPTAAELARATIWPAADYLRAVSARIDHGIMAQSMAVASMMNVVFVRNETM